MTMAKDKIMISINGELQEAKSEVLEQIQKDQAEAAILEAEYKAKQEARESAIKKLGEIAGLTKEELSAIL
jgi:hypothetical protein